MHFLIGSFIVFVLWENPVTRALILTALVALLSFSLLSVAIAWLVTAVVLLVLCVGAAGELQARREWREEDRLLRQAALRRARRELDHG